MKVFGNINEISEIGKLKITSLQNSQEVMGAVRYGGFLCIELCVNTQLLTHGANVSVTEDESRKLLCKKSMELFSHDSLYISFAVNINIEQLCNDNSFLFLCIEIQTEYGNFYISRRHEGSLELTKMKSDLQLTVYSSEYEVPEKFCGGIMYHIFPDRFNIGQRRTEKKYASNVADWDSPIPQYADIPGGDVKNDCFYGGNLYGIAEKAEYLASLGVNYLYLCPIFESSSNHKYDTGNYMKVDECFGGDKALSYLVDTMKKYGISVILDGVFNHTGDDSIYFNKRGTYDSVGAYNSKESPYYEWYTFEKYPEKYRCWWGIDILPEINTENNYFTEYICGEYGVINKYIKIGVEGFRLDVADELSDCFLENVRKRLKKENPQAVLLGEVWEDASNKIAYGKRRRYFRGHQLDSVMNYPLREGIIRYLLKRDSEYLAQVCFTLRYNYPEFVFNSLMNFLSTHDTERILSVLCDDGISSLSNTELSRYNASNEDLNKAKRLLKIGYALLFTLPGVPSVYYGDEAGVQGGRDPFNRRTFPWGSEDKDLTDYVRKLGNIRKGDKRFSFGEFNIIEYRNGVFCFERIFNNDRIIICANMTGEFYRLYTGNQCYDSLNACEYEAIVNVPPENVVFCEKK